MLPKCLALDNVSTVEIVNENDIQLQSFDFVKNFTV